MPVRRRLPGDRLDRRTPRARRRPRSAPGELAAHPHQVNAYASWTPTEGFGIHWDDHDVIVVQVEGAKRWRLYGPTRQAPMHHDVAFPEPPPEPPVADVVLNPGDVLYLPRGWWHAVTADQGTDSLYLTCGIGPDTGAHLIGWLPERLRTHGLVRADLPLHACPGAQEAYVESLHKLLMDALDEPDLIGRFAAARDAEGLGRLHPLRPSSTASLRNRTSRCG
ncbi:JmjC domain-containing protein [Streptomyces sp. NPDC059697]|uniref:JmjC domain-containing protein n=1 Tax=Streptomyces sp. NPDC059697 TaxID=3346912 RepID=UPI0036C1C7CA